MAGEDDELTNDNNAGLTQEKTERLLQFQDLTGIEDIERCRTILTTHNWDIEVAVQDTFNEEEGAPSVFTQHHQIHAPEGVMRPQRMPAMNLHPNDQRIYQVAARQPQGLMQWSYFLVLLPFRFLYTTLLDLFRFALEQGLRIFPHCEQQNKVVKDRLLRPDPRRTVTDPVGDVMSFIRLFDERYADVHPIFYQGSYSQALNDAKHELRFLLVYLHGDDHQDTDAFCRNTLCNDEVVQFMNTRLLFWACNINSPEGYRVSQALRENTYPFLALVVLRDNRMAVVARIEGPIDGADLVSRLSTVMDDNETVLAAARADRDERSFTQTLRKQQDEAYLESLRADQEKERRKKEEREQREQEEQRARAVIEERERQIQEREKRKEVLRNQIPPEPPVGDANAIRVMLKLPTGIRLERRFMKTQSLKHLYYFIFCHEDCPDDFNIVTNFPRKQLPCEPSADNLEPPTFEEVGLGKSEMLFVQDNEA